MHVTRGGLCVLLLLLALHAVGLLLFCKGFLLRRVVISKYSECHPGLEPGTQDTPDTERSVPPSCTGYPRQFRRVVWLLVDALRYDFAAFDPTPSEPLPAYQNKLPFIRDLLRQQPRHAKLFRFVADPPTTTMQRLKALTTGSLPTFVDFGSNFNSYEISEDSLPYQARAANKTFTFIGDDTWLGLYPGMMTRAFAYPSLNVKDLHTVDNGVVSHMVPELERGDSEFVVGHFLGVDHVGHTYGPAHPSMAEKLEQMNGVLESIFAAVDEDTIVFVFGDHGMTPTGDHGGETALETDAALLLYTPRALFDPAQISGRSVFQTDIVPTVSLLLGMPIPFSNLGMIIPEVFLPFVEDSHENVSEHKPSTPEMIVEGRVTVDFLRALKINSEQISSYLETYVEYSEDFPQDTYRSLRDGLHLANQLHDDIFSREAYIQADLSHAAAAYIEYMEAVKRMCQSVWAKFDDRPIVEGLILLLLSVIVALVSVANLPKAVAAQLAVRGGFAIGSLLGLASLIVERPHLDFDTSSLLSLVTPFLFYSLLATSLAFVWCMKRDVFNVIHSILIQSKPLGGVSDSASQLLATLATVLYCLSLLSNSFILYEADMVVFLLQTMVVSFTLERLKRDSSAKKTARSRQEILPHSVWIVLQSVGLMSCVRLTKLFHTCRDLQVDCKPSTFTLALPMLLEESSKLFAWLRFLCSCLCVVGVPVSLAVVLRQNSYYKLLSTRLSTAFTYVLPVASICACGFWALLTLPQPTLDSLPSWQHTVLPRLAYLISGLVVAVVIGLPFSPPPRILRTDVATSGVKEYSDPPSTTRFRKTDSLSDYFPRKSDTEPAASHDGITAQRDEAVIVAPLVMLLCSVWVSLAMLLGDGFALAALLLVMQVALTVSLVRPSQDHWWPVSVFWGLTCCQYFFAFGHHATVTSLRFEAGFVGHHGEITAYSLPLAGVLVGLNTLASQLLCGLGLPLVCLLGRASKGPASSLEQLVRVAVLYLTFHSLKLLVSIAAASLHRRHLMVWGVFSPRFLYESAFQLASDGTAIAVVLLVGRLLKLVDSVQNH